MKHEVTAGTPRETLTRTASGMLIYCRELFEKDLYRHQMPQVRGEELQLAAPRPPSPTAVKPATPATVKKQRGTTARP
ncbi:MAG TPA: hypothetical protein PLU72_14305 [Candidatus Ozemobacteraceae bacterium]|nr:hypothetical protein [Candidatus Ozemobacteraceae bacterium]HQG27363.1 hypothetical protein [Candidatus Ozemobacteraceae bacterium]